MTTGTDDQRAPGGPDTIHPRDVGEPSNRDSEGFPAPRRLWIHASCLAMLLLVLLPIVENGYLAAPDEGIYSAQASNLAEGSWSSPRPAPELDPTGRWDGLSQAEIKGERHIPYARHPAYPILLTPFFIGGETVGLLLLSAIGTWLASVTAALLTARLVPRFSVAALWLTGVGSPLLFDSYLVIGHSIAAGCFGLLMLSTSWVIEERRRWSIVVLGVSAALLTLLRTEGGLVVSVAAGVIGLSSLRFRPRAGIDWRRAATSGTLLMLALSAYVADSRWANAVSGRPLSSSRSFDRNANPLRSAWNDLVRPWFGEATLPSVSMIVLLVCVTVGAVARRLLPKHTLLPLVLLAIAAIASLTRHFEDLGYISGLAAAFPLTIIGLSQLRGSSLKHPLTRRIGGVVTLGAGAIAVTTYGEGGATQWGGRFYHVLIPAIVPLIMIGLDRARHGLNRHEVAVAVAAMLLICGSIGALAIRTNAARRTTTRNVVTSTMRMADRSSGGSSALIVASPVEASGLSRSFWREISDGADVLTSNGIGGLAHVLTRASVGGHTEVIVVTNTSDDTVELLLRRTLTDLDWAIIESRITADQRYNVVRIGSRTSG